MEDLPLYSMTIQVISGRTMHTLEIQLIKLSKFMNLMNSSDMKMKNKDKLSSQGPLGVLRDKACLAVLLKASRAFALGLKVNASVLPKADIKTLKSLATLTAIDMLM